MDEEPADDVLANLQSLLMEQQVAMDALAEQALVQEQRFNDLKRRLDLLEQRLQMILELGSPGAAATGADEKPPHY